MRLRRRALSAGRGGEFDPDAAEMLPVVTVLNGSEAHIPTGGWWHAECKARASSMLRELVSLAPPPVGIIQEVVLSGIQSIEQHLLRQRALQYLRRETCCERIWLGAQVPMNEACVSLRDWSNPAADALNFDRLFNSVRRQGPFRLVLWTKDWLAGAQPALEILNRHQPLLARDRGSALPELREASDDAVDVWLWALRLQPTASLDVQRAALRGDEPSRQRAQFNDGLLLLRDATDLSFFARRSWQYLRAWGLEQTQCTVERRLGRMSDAALSRVLGTRQPPEISSMVDTFFALRDASSVAV
jgi:hypothetical protein